MTNKITNNENNDDTFDQNINNFENPAIIGSRNVNKYERLNRIEEGTYGTVFRAKEIKTGRIYALKRLKLENEREGFPITSLREIVSLMKVRHQNIVNIKEVVIGSTMNKVYIVMEYVEHDLRSLLYNISHPFMLGEIKTLLLQLINGIKHLHDNWILHRDIKTSNLLLNNRGILKIGDFGLAREYGSPLRNYTPVVVTLWYRAPELLLGQAKYSPAVDIWSCGCVFGELINKKVLFPGKSEIDQIGTIFRELGTPNDIVWPGPISFSEHPVCKKTVFPNYIGNRLKARYGTLLTESGYDLLNKFLTYDPNLRITSERILEHTFFKEAPYPLPTSIFPSWPPIHESKQSSVKYNDDAYSSNFPMAPKGGETANMTANNKDVNNSSQSHLFNNKNKKLEGAGFTLKF